MNILKGSLLQPANCLRWSKKHGQAFTGLSLLVSSASSDCLTWIVVITGDDSDDVVVCVIGLIRHAFGVVKLYLTYSCHHVPGLAVVATVHMA